MLVSMRSSNYRYQAILLTLHLSHREGTAFKNGRHLLPANVDDPPQGDRTDAIAICVIQVVITDVVITA